METRFLVSDSPYVKWFERALRGVAVLGPPVRDIYQCFTDGPIKPRPLPKPLTVGPR